MDYLVLSEFIKSIEFPAKVFFRKLPVDKGVTTPANVDASLTHIDFVKVFSEPFVAMAGLRDQMVKSDKTLTSAQGTMFVHSCRPEVSLKQAGMLQQ